MKILAVADLHLTENRIDEYRHEFCRKELPRMLHSQKASGLLILGDLTEAKDRHSGHLVNQVITHLAVCAAHCPVVVMMGNHDYANEGEPFFRFADHLPGVTFINSPTDGGKLPRNLRDRYGDCMFLPHSRNPDRDWEGLAFDDYRFVFAHQAFQDADAGFGRKLDGYPTDRFKRTKVIAGDIHKPQTIGPIEYIGAPYTVDFGDDYVPRMLSIDGTKVRSEWLDAFPQKKMVKCLAGEDLLDHQKDLSLRDIVRVRVDVDSMDGWNAITKVVHKQADQLDVIIERVEPNLMKKAQRYSVKPVSGSSKASDSELVRQFSDRNRLTDAVLDMGLDIVEEK